MGGIDYIGSLKKRRTESGFTLVELLVVLAIMAILIAVAVPTMTGALADAKEKSAMSEARAAYIAFEIIRSGESKLDEITPAKIAGYLSIDVSAFDCGVLFESDFTADSSVPVKAFYYADTYLISKNRYIRIEMGGKAAVEDGDINSLAAGLGSKFLLIRTIH